MAEQLSAAQRSKIRRLSAPKEPEEGEEAGELNIVPFLDIITNVMMFVLASIAVTFTASIETSPPSSGKSGSFKATQTKSLNLSVFVVNDGFSLKASGGSIATGCRSPGGGITVPKANGGWDFAGLNDCVKYLKDQSPDFKEETQVTITANPDTEYAVIIKTMDALRRNKDGEDLFPDVHFGVPR
jgi:biopolymer transport protein ExbD